MPQRLSRREWLESVEAYGLFAPRQPKSGLGRDCCAQHSLTGLVLSPAALAFLSGSPELVRRLCDGVKAAKIVLTQTSLGSFIPRTRIGGGFRLAARRDSEICLAMRFILHG